MTEPELIKGMREKIIDVIHAHINSTAWAEEEADQIFTFIKEAGYRLPTDTAPLLTEEEIDDLIHSYFDPADFGILYPDRKPFEAVAEAQRDADHKFYGGKRGTNVD